MIPESLKKQVVRDKSSVFRRAYVKRMLSTGIFESEWQEITDDVKRWGRVVQSVDADRYSKFNFNSLNMTVNNEDGSYLAEDDTRSFWYGYASQQRTLLRIEAGYSEKELGEDGIWNVGETPGVQWDVAHWDDPADTFDLRPVIFTGIISGDIMFSDKYEVALTVMPILEVFRSFPARNLTGFTSTGLTASQFCELLRDQTDGAGNFLFRPFLNDTTAAWNIQSTTSIYTQLNTSTAQDIISMNTWEVLERLAEAEDFVCFVSGDGQFYFRDKDAVTSTAAYEFHGLGSVSREWGHSIKSIDQFGRKFSKYYSRVSVQWSKEDTTTSYAIVETSLTVSGLSSPWIYGHRTLEIANYWIPSATTAQILAQNIYDNVNALKREVKMTTVFLPGLNVSDKISVNYDPSQAAEESLWDLNNWGDTGTAILSDDLVWDLAIGDSFYLNQEEMKIVQIELDLDKLDTKITARET